MNPDNKKQISQFLRPFTIEVTPGGTRRIDDFGIQSLLRYATACGVGASMQFLTRRAWDLRKLLSVQAPDKLVADIANYVAAHPESLISGVHIFPLGGFEKSAAWANSVAAGKFKIKADGFDVLGSHPR